MIIVISTYVYYDVYYIQNNSVLFDSWHCYSVYNNLKP